MKQIYRRTFLGSALASAALAAAKPVRIGIVGVGGRGFGLLRILLEMEGVEVPAVCDIDGKRLTRALDAVEKSRGKRPEGYSRGEEDFCRMVTRDDLDAVLCATTWEWHAPVSVAAMRAAKYAAVEVPAAITLDQCWDLVKTSEQTRMPCMMLENVNYFRNVMLVLNMVQMGLFGEVVHCAGGYHHDTRFLDFLENGELAWRGRHAAKLNGNLYPTHPIGPICRWMNINRGDRFTRLVSMSTVSRGLNDYAARKFGASHELAKRQYTQGDVNTTLIQTARGYSVVLGFEMQTPRPYDLAFRVQGTKASYSGTLDKIYVESGEPKQAEKWTDLQPYYDKYEHPMWKQAASMAGRYSHGGADFFVLREFVEAVRQRTQTPIDVYDSATWSAIFPLTIQSVAAGTSTVEFPDFTGGKWKKA
jgi:hypothetical protein